MNTETPTPFTGTLPEWLGYLEQLHSREIDLGLERVSEVARRLGVPTASTGRLPRVLTFAGTNGKGSTLAMVESMALAAGYQVGSYTSPHFLHFNERIKIQGTPVATATLVEAFEKIEQARLADNNAVVSLSYFEFATLAALVIFAESNLDLWLLEVGLGGRLDAVNLVDADVAVVTTLGLDHQDYLGDDLESIGREKAGIFRAGCPAVLGSTCLPLSVIDQAQKLGCQRLQLGQDFLQENQGATWVWQGQNAAGHSLKFSQLPWPVLPKDNAATSIQALLATGLDVSEEAVRSGLAKVQLAGRMQRHGAWLLDVAHNPQAAEHLAQRLAEQPAKRRLAILGMMKDKDQLATVSPLLDLVDAWAVTALPLARAEQPQALQALLEGLGASVVSCYLQSDGEALYQQAQAALQQGLYDEVLVFGSFFTLALIMEKLAAEEES